MTSKIRCYSELKHLATLEERYRYLALRGRVGDATFGFDRWMNQMFYRSAEWRRIRQHVIVRDRGCDLGIAGWEIHHRVYIHHMNPMTVDNFREGGDEILDPEFLVATTLLTHNAIHYGDETQLPQELIERVAGDTKLW